MKRDGVDRMANNQCNDEIYAIYEVRLLTYRGRLIGDQSLANGATRRNDSPGADLPTERITIMWVSRDFTCWPFSMD